MTKKDYIIIAECIKVQELVDSNLEKLSAFDYKVRLISRLSEAFLIDNPRFDKNKFRKFINN